MILLDRLADPITKGLAIALGVSLAFNAVGGWALWHTWGLIGAERQRMADVKQANADNVATMTQLKAELDKANAAVAVAAEKAAQVDEAHAATLRVIEREHAAERAARTALYATDKDCAALTRVRVCDAIADRLRAHPSGAGADDHR